MFFADYLSKRTHCVYVKDEYLSELTVTSGVPEVSVFEVSMFVVYINDLPSLMENSTYRFADDTNYLKSNEFIFATK